jgi:hypothetical protein
MTKFLHLCCLDERCYTDKDEAGPSFWGQMMKGLGAPEGLIALSLMPSVAGADGVVLKLMRISLASSARRRHSTNASTFLMA